MDNLIKEVSEQHLLLEVVFEYISITIHLKKHLNIFCRLFFCSDINCYKIFLKIFV